MRIISGIFKGRNLKVPDTKFTRPTTDRVRETIFNLLTNKIDFDGITVLDIYAGSGSLGLESLSRGASSAHFVEKNIRIVKILQQNIDSLNVGEFCNIIKSDATLFAKYTDHKKYDLIFADPPFFKTDIYAAAQNILANGFLNKKGVFLIERSIQTKENDSANLGIEPFKRIGDTLLYMFEQK